MKANKMLFVTALSLITFQAMSPTEFLAFSKSNVGRMPAAEAKKAPAKKPVAKKPVTSKEMKALQDKLALLEKDLKNKEVLLDQKSKEIDQLKSVKTEEKIDALTKLITEQKSDIDKLKLDIKNSEIKDVKIHNNNNTSVEVVICKTESKGEKLEAEMKKLLEDKEAVLKEVDGLKKENGELKIKLTTTPEAKPEVVADVKPEVKPEAKPEVKSEDKKEPVLKKSENSELIALMAQMTSMFSAQMQTQMQMQVQMMNMLSQMQSNMMPEISPYAYNPSQNFRSQNYGYPFAGSYGSYGNYSLSDSIGLGGYGIGLQAPSSPWSDYQNPYSSLPSLNRHSIPQSFDFGFGANQPQRFQGFDFNQAPATTEQPSLQRQQMPFSSQTISV